LFLQLEASKHKYVEAMNRFMHQLDDMQEKNKQYEELKQRHYELEETLKEQLEHQQLIQKTMEQEVIALAARNSSLEQSKDELHKLLEQRDYEIEVLKTQMDSERKQSNVYATRQQHLMSIVSETGATLDTLQTIQQTNEEEQENDNDNDETEQNSNQIEGTNENKTTNNNNTEFEDFINEVLNDDTITKDDDDNKNYNFVNRGNNVFVPDVIKEYLHLTASAVKIKFPRVTTFTSEQLINQVKSLPFFQYHDYMSRIMEKEENKIKMQESLLSSNHASPTPNSRKPNHQTNMKQRRSFLSLFGKFFFR